MAIDLWSSRPKCRESMMAEAAVAEHQREQTGAQREDAATRHLCAGVHLDPSFRDLVLRGVHNDSARMVAPSYGFDLVPVVEHAWLSWRLEILQHVYVLTVFVIGLA